MSNYKISSTWIAGMLSVAVLLSGCGTNGGNKSNEVKNTKPIELSVFWMDNNTAADTTLPIFAKAAEITNVTMKNKVSKSTSDGKQAFGLMMASRELADIVNYNVREDFFKYGSEGAFVALNDLIEKNAPNFKKFLSSRPDVKKFITSPDGKIYFIPFVPDGSAAKGWFIRQDWIEKLNLTTPKNTEEYYNTLVAFRDKDPNGNGKKDEIPYFNRNVGPQWEEGISDLYSMWGAHKSWYAKDGKVHYGAIEPEYKQAIINVTKWYKEKLIDPEIFTRSTKAREILLGNNIGGSTHDWFGSNAGFNDSLKDKIPNFKFVAFLPPSGKEHTRRELLPVGWAVSSTNKYPVETIKYFDFWFSEQGRTLANYGLEGKQYTMVDGKAKFNDSVLKGGKPALDVLHGVGAQLLFGYYQDFEYEKQWMNPIALKGINEYTQNNSFGETFPPLTRSPQDEKRYSELVTALDTHRDEMVPRWVLGNESVEAGFDKYVESMKTMKIDELIEIQQRAYDVYMKN